LINANKQRQKAALRTLALMVLVLTGFPKFSIKVGPVPFYIMDALILFLYLQSRYLPAVTKAQKGYFNIEGPLKLTLFLIALSEIVSGLIINSLLEPIYLTIRFALAVSLYFSISRTINSMADVIYVARFALWGGLITGSLLILYSISFTRPWVNATVFSLKFLEPSKTGTELFYEAQSGIRGQSLVGISIISGAFLNVIWPFTLMQLNQKNLPYRRWLLILIANFIIPFGVIATYSRGAILGLVMVIFGVLAYSKGRLRNVMIFGVVVLLTFFTVVGWDSEVFFFSRVATTANRILDTEQQTVSETERLYAYTEPFEHLFENPLNLFFGEGFAIKKVDDDFREDANDRADHSVFSQAYYAYGMIVAIFYLYFVFYGVSTTYRLARKKNVEAAYFSRAVLAGLLGLLPWFIFGHAAVSTPRGAMLFYFLLAMTGVQYKVHYNHNRYRKILEYKKWKALQVEKEKETPKIEVSKA
jgi:hypothetical protein